MQEIFDYLIVGAGVAGLSCASHIPKNKKVLIVCKKSPWECNTFFAQGGIAFATDQKDIKSHVDDTMKAGSSLNNKEAVELLSSQSIDAMHDLINNNMCFDTNENGLLAYTKEAAHSKSRILHADGDATGRILHMHLLKRCKHNIVNNSIVVDLIYENNICYGAQIIRNNELKTIFAHNTILVSGGVGSLYKYHTNSTTIAGDIQGICLEKDLILKDMDMMQFHPTVFINNSMARKQLLTEALRGEGAVIEDENGYAFLKDYHPDKELAPRDIVSRAIFEYSNNNKLQVYLSFKNFNKNEFKKRFPNIYHNLKNYGFNLPSQRVPISPAFHYSMGGIEVDLTSKVKKTKNLYAVGEVACIGIHGANRLASNSLLEGLVFSKIAIQNSKKINFKINIDNIANKTNIFQLQKATDKIIKNDLRSLMWKNVGIIREKSKLIETLNQINVYLEKDIGRLLHLRLLTAKSIVQSAIKRKGSIGAHYIKEKEC